jgi:uncharacterized protein
MRHVVQSVSALIAIAFGCMVAFSGAGVAQQVTTSSDGRIAPPRDGYNVFIIGDALAGGLWAGTTRVGTQYREFAITGRFKEESGLARPEIYDWGSAVPKILERHHVDIAIVLIGTNDGQDIRTQGGRMAFGTPEWTIAYEAAVDEVIAAFREQGVTVYWIGLPPMRSTKHNEAVRAIATLQRQRVLANSAKYIDVGPEFANPDGSYAESGVGIDGNNVRLRSLNGVKFIRAGNDKLATLVFDAIRADLELAPAGAVVAEGGGELAVTEHAMVPVFGMDLADGSAHTLPLAELPVRLAEHDEVQGARLDLEQAADAPAAPGGAAAALFATGRWPTPKPGRIDDFRWPQAQ